MTLDIDKFTKHLYGAANKKLHSQRRCGEYVRKALQAGGAEFYGAYPATGKEFGPTLERLGFHQITVENPDIFHFLKGDVMVMDPYTGSTAGHVAAFDGNNGSPTSFRKTSGRGRNTGRSGRTMLSIAISRSALAVALWAMCQLAGARADDRPPRYLSVPVLGLRVEVAGLKLDAFPEELRANCPQIADDETYTGRAWIFGRAKDASSAYYVLTGYFKRREAMAGEPQYRLWESGSVFTVTGTRCGGDDAAETFAVHDPNADIDGNMPERILRELARDLVAQTVRAVGGPDRLRVEIKNQRIDADQLPAELREAFAPYFSKSR